MGKTTPPRRQARRQQILPKVLVVEADSFVLTSKQDPQVIFWNAAQTAQGLPLPASLEILWLSQYVLDSNRERLLQEATANNVVVWDCQIKELQRRLTPYWHHDWNRSFFEPMVVSDHGIVGSSYVPSVPGPEQTKEKKTERLGRLKAAARRLQTGKQAKTNVRGKKGKNEKIVSIQKWKAGR